MKLNRRFLNRGRHGYLEQHNVFRKLPRIWYLWPVVRGMGSKKMKLEGEQWPTARKVLSLLSSRGLGIWNLPCGCGEATERFYARDSYAQITLTLCTVGKTVYWKVKHPVNYCLPHNKWPLCLGLSLNESHRRWLSTKFPEVTAPSGNLISPLPLEALPLQ